MSGVQKLTSDADAEQAEQLLLQAQANSKFLTGLSDFDVHNLVQNLSIVQFSPDEVVMQKAMPSLAIH